jgi:hypothetical protein
VPLDAYAVPHHPCAQETPDDTEQAFVANAPGQTGHENVVVHPVEELFQVKIHNCPVSVSHILLGLAQGIVRPAPGAEAKARY